MVNIFNRRLVIFCVIILCGKSEAMAFSRKVLPEVFDGNGRNGSLLSSFLASQFVGHSKENVTVTDSPVLSIQSGRGSMDSASEISNNSFGVLMSRLANRQSGGIVHVAKVPSALELHELGNPISPVRKCALEGEGDASNPQPIFDEKTFEEVFTGIRDEVTANANANASLVAQLGELFGSNEYKSFSSFVQKVVSEPKMVTQQQKTTGKNSAETTPSFSTSDPVELIPTADDDTIEKDEFNKGTTGYNPRYRSKFNFDSISLMRKCTLEVETEEITEVEEIKDDYAIFDEKAIINATASYLIEVVATDDATDTDNFNQATNTDPYSVGCGKTDFSRLKLFRAQR